MHLSYDLVLIGELTFYHSITIFNDPGKEAFWKHCVKRRLFPQYFPTFQNQISTFILLSAYAFNLDQSNILSFGKELIGI